MLGLLRSAFCILAMSGITFAACPERHNLLPGLSFTLSGLSLAWPDASTKSIYESTGRYIPRNVIATRTQMYKDSAIVAFPRYKPGVPFTIGVVNLATKESNEHPVVAPFPCSTLQEEGNCEALQSAVDIVLDVRNILWVLDVGIVNTLEQAVRRCQPKIVAIDVTTGNVVKVINLSHLVNSASRLQYLVVDYANDGKAYLYISDAATRAIISYDVAADRGFRVVLPKAVTLGCSRNDVLYMNLIRKPCGTPVLYLTYLGSSRMFSVNAENLRAGTAGGTIVDVGPKPNKIVLLGTDNGCNIFFRNKGQSDVYMWNTGTSFVPDNFILVQKGNDCRLPTQVVPGYRNLMWVVESNFHDYIQDTVGCAGASVSLHPLVKAADDL